MTPKSTRFILFLVFIIISACSPKYYHVEQTQEQRIFITDSLTADQEIKGMISPYKAKMVGELDRVLSYTPIDLNLDGANSSLGNLVADVLFEDGNRLLKERYPEEKIDIVLMNRGGLRRTFTAGDLSVRSFYELMPFENEVVVVRLSGSSINQMVAYLRNSNRNHPIAGIKFRKNTNDKEIYIGGKLLEANKDYYVLTNDYLQKGGDKMTFFKEAKDVEYLNIKLRDLFIQHFDKVDTVKVNMEPRYLD